MGLLKMGCLGLIVVAGVAAVTMVSLSSNKNKPVEIPEPQQQKKQEKKPVEDPVKKKYGMTESELKGYAGASIKNLVKEHLKFPADASISSWNEDIRFFEYELYDEKTKKTGDTVAGFNVSNKCSVTSRTRKEKHSYGATLRYNPKDKKWTLISFTLDGKTIESK
ncbi:MAG: hypothetical protein J5858_07915 [Lentisphaeria bacterium]|nr:hypothetical protein [Lentisphaeria bacterium]